MAVSFFFRVQLFFFLPLFPLSHPSSLSLPLKKKQKNKTSFHSYAEANQRLDYRFDAKAVAQVKARFLSLARVVCIKEFMSGWFHGAHPDTIGRGNVEDFVAYGFYTRTKADLPREQRDAIEAFVREVERRWGVTFAAGRNPALRFMAHLWEPLRVIHKPLALHAACEAATLTSHAALWCAGFRKHHVAGFDYWYREPIAVPSPAAAAAAPAAASVAAPPAASSAAPSAPASEDYSDFEDISRSPSDESGGEAATATRASSASEGEEAAAAAVAARANNGARASSSSQQRAALNGNGNGLWRRGDSFSSLAGRSPLRSRRNTAGAADGASTSEAAAESGAAAAASAPASASGPSASAAAAAAEEAARAAPAPAKKRPVFFVHGVGFGLVPYLGLIALIARAVGRDRPLALLEVPHVSLRFRSRRAQPVDDVAAAAVAVLARHGHDDAAFVAHSYGTFCVSRICQLHRRAVAAALLVDPVCCLTCYPHLLFNFVYKIPSMTAALAGGAAGALNVARFLFSRDLTIAETFCRRVRRSLFLFFVFPLLFGDDDGRESLQNSLFLLLLLLLPLSLSLSLSLPLFSITKKHYLISSCGTS